MTKQVFALIGGIASGKSAASDILGSLGAYVIDADVISHEVTARGSVGEAKLMKRFPSCIDGGVLNRRKLKELVFNDEKELKALNEITHPLITDEIERRLAHLSGIAIVVMPIPMGLRRFSAILNIYAPRSERIERLMKRDNIDRDLAEKIMAAQWSEEQYGKVADFTFVNDGDLTKLCNAIKNWWNVYVEDQNHVNSRGARCGDDGDFRRH